MSEQRLTMRERAVGAYVGLAVGDALGATTEFMTPREIREKYGSHDAIVGGGWLRLKPGQVTDDTQMSLALGEAILASRAVIPEKVAEAFSEWMRGKPIDIGNTVRRGIVHFRRTGSAEVAVNEYDAGNGACMRSLPVALFCCHASASELVQSSRRQAHTTHNNPLADAGTETVLQMLALTLAGCEKHELESKVSSLVSRFPIYRFNKRRVENPSGYIVETLQVVFQAFFSLKSFEEILIDVVNRGGDADTTGAIAGMLAGAYYGPDAIPTRWSQKIETGVMQRCMNQAESLLTQGREIYLRESA